MTDSNKNDITMETKKDDNVMVETESDEEEAIDVPKPKHIKIAPPPVYDGVKDAIVIENWAFSVSEYCEFYDVTGTKAVQLGASYLSGRARAFWRKYKADATAGILEKEPTKNLTAFLNLIGGHFYPLDYVQTVRDKLHDVKQTGSAENFIEVFDRLVTMLPSGSYTDADMMDQFIRKLKPATQMQVKLKQPRTLKEAYLYAKGCDPIIFQNRNLFGNRSNNGPPAAPRTPPPRRYGDEMDVDESEVRRSNYSCYNCGKKGHFSKDCKAPKSDKTKRYEAKRLGNGSQQK